jgi:hypothetical protein
MRRALALTGLTLAAAAALTGVAQAKDMSVALAESAPTALAEGEDWNATLLVHGEPDMLREATPSIRITNTVSGASEDVDAARTKSKAADGQMIYAASVSFPSAGVWRYSLIDGVTDREYEGGTIQVGTAAAAASSAPSTPAPAAPATASDDGGGSPFWPLVVGGALLLVLAGLGAYAVTRHRHGPQPTA